MTSGEASQAVNKIEAKAEEMQGNAAPEEAHRNWTIVVALSRNGIIGRQNRLPWKLSSDLQRFKQMTWGHCLLMGRKTFQSIGKALPGRQTIVLSRSLKKLASPGVSIAAHLSQVAELAEPNRKIMVVGGAEVFREAIPFCHTMWITRVLANIEGDTYFPKIDWDEWQLLSSTYHAAGPKDDWPTEFEVWCRKPSPSTG